MRKRNQGADEKKLVRTYKRCRVSRGSPDSAAVFITLAGTIAVATQAALVL